jgi:MFS family permease
MDEFGLQNLLIGFRVAYSIGQSVCGRLMDRVGTRRGLTLSVLWYSLVSIATSLAGGFYSFATLLVAPRIDTLSRVSAPQPARVRTI